MLPGTTTATCMQRKHVILRTSWPLNTSCCTTQKTNRPMQRPLCSCHSCPLCHELLFNYARASGQDGWLMSPTFASQWLLRGSRYQAKVGARKPHGRAFARTAQEGVWLPPMPRCGHYILWTPLWCRSCPVRRSIKPRARPPESARQEHVLATGAVERRWLKRSEIILHSLRFTSEHPADSPSACHEPRPRRCSTAGPETVCTLERTRLRNAAARAGDHIGAGPALICAPSDHHTDRHLKAPHHPLPHPHHHGCLPNFMARTHRRCCLAWSISSRSCACGCSWLRCISNPRRPTPCTASCGCCPSLLMTPSPGPPRQTGCGGLVYDKAASPRRAFVRVEFFIVLAVHLPQVPTAFVAQWRPYICRLTSVPACPDPAAGSPIYDLAGSGGGRGAGRGRRLGAHHGRRRQRLRWPPAPGAGAGALLSGESQTLGLALCWSISEAYATVCSPCMDWE